MGKPEGFLQRITPDRFKAQDVDSKLQRWAGRLAPESRHQLEEAMGQSSFDQQVDAFAETVTLLRSKEGPRPLYAATVLGMRQLADETDNLLVDLTAATTCDAEHAIDSAYPEYLDRLTRTAVDGLGTYRQTPDFNPFEFAAELEREVRFTLPESASVLAKQHPRLTPHLEWFEIASRANEGYSSGWLGQLRPDTPLARAFHLVLEEQQRIFGDEAAIEVKEMILDARDCEDNAEIRQLGQQCWDALESNWNLSEVLEELDAMATHQEKSAERQVERLSAALEPGLDHLAYAEDGVEVGEQYLPYLFA